MADKVVELRKTQEEAAPPVVAARPRASRARLRLMLLVVIPLIALAVGATSICCPAATSRPTTPMSARRRC